METGNVKKDISLVRKRLVQKEEKSESKALWGMTVLCFASMTSMCVLFLKAFSVKAGWILYPGILFYCILFTGYYEKRAWKKYRIAILLGMLFVVCVLLVFTQRSFLDSMECIWNHMARQINQTYQGSLSETSGGQGTGSYFLMVILFWLTWFLAKGIIDRQDRGYFLMIAIPAVFLVLLSGGRISKPAMFVLVLCFLCNIAMSSVRKKEKLWGGEESEEFRKNQKTGQSILKWIMINCVTTGALLLGISFYGGQKIITVPIMKLTEVSAPVKGKGMQILYDILPKISGGKLNLSLEGVGGGVSDGKLGDIEGSSYDGIEAVKVTSSVKPSEILYLKGFIGSDYAGDSWKPGDENEFENAALNWKTQDDDASLYIQNLPFLRMMYAQNILKESGTELNENQDAVQAELAVERLNANTRYTYVPYQAYLNDYYRINGGDGAVEGQTAQDDNYAWYPQSQYTNVMEEWNRQEESHGALDELEASYSVYVKNHYKNVPKDMKKLKKLCHIKKKEWNKKIRDDMTKDQLKDLEQEKITDVKKFVVRTLWERCRFTETEKKLPEGEDYVEYFLFHEKKGDSTAFASAAAMMFRECGIPARYVVGYAAPANLFTETSDGKYMAVLQDDNAHAWAEIYVSGIGWTPVETTPGFSGTVENMQMDENEKDAQIKNEKKKSEPSVKKLRDGTKKVFDKLEAWMYTRFVAIGIIIALIFALVWIRRCIVRAKRRGKLGKQNENEKIKKIFISFYELLKADGFPKEIDTMEEGFVEELSVRYKGITKESWKEVMQIVLEANYGYMILGELQTQTVLCAYESMVKEIVAKMPVGRKMVCIFWSAF